MQKKSKQRLLERIQLKFVPMCVTTQFNYFRFYLFIFLLRFASC